MRRVYAPAMRAVISTLAFLWIMALVVQLHTIWDGTMNALEGDYVCATRSSVYPHVGIAISQISAAWPTFVFGGISYDPSLEPIPNVHYDPSAHTEKYTALSMRHVRNFGIQ
jgi:hypothetical protein